MLATLQLRCLTILALLAVGGCAAHLESPEAVTNVDVDRYQFGLDQDCRDAGAKHGQSPSEIDAFCNCVFDTLNRDLSRSDWNRAVFFYLNGNEHDEERVMAPFLKKVIACRALALPASVAGDFAPSPPPLVGRWQWTRPVDECKDVYTFRRDGTARIESGNARSENTYTLSTAPEASGRQKISLTTTEYLKGLNCDGSAVDTTGTAATVYVRLGVRNSRLMVCKSASGLDCIGPLKRNGGP